MQCNERIVGSRRLDAVSLKERVTSENNRDGETYYPCERQTCYDVSRFYCTSLMIPTIRCVFKVRIAEGCTRDRSCIHERSCEREETKKKEMGEWENRGEKDGGVKSKRNEIEQRKEGRKRKMENNRGAWRREDRQTRWYHYKRADNRISTQFVWDSLPCRMGNPQKPWFLSSLFRPSSFCHRNTFSGILSITPERTANIIRTAASLTDRKIFLRSRILWCLFGVWVVCETLFSSPLKNRDLHIRPSIPAADLAIFSFLLSLVSRIFKGIIRRAVGSFYPETDNE